MDQDSTLLANIKVAWRSWYVFSYMPRHEIKWTDEDAEFIAWVNDGESD